MQLPDRLSARIAAFSLVGAANGIVGISVILIAGVLGVRPVLANVLGYGAGLLLSFTLNSRVTFQTRSVDRYTVLRFLTAFIISFVVNLTIVMVATNVFGLHKLLGSLAGTPFYVLMFYLLCEYWVFRHQPPSG